MLSVSHIRLVSSANDTIPLGMVRKDSSDRHAIVVDVPSALPRGTYTVHWWTAASDGHPANGTLTFEVAAGPASSDAAKPAISTRAPRDPSELAAARRATRIANAVQSALGAPMWLARWLAFIALFIVVGAVGFRYVVLQRLAPASTESVLWPKNSMCAEATRQCSRKSPGPPPCNVSIASLTSSALPTACPMCWAASASSVSTSAPECVPSTAAAAQPVQQASPAFNAPQTATASTSIAPTVVAAPPPTVPPPTTGRFTLNVNVEGMAPEQRTPIVDVGSRTLALPDGD